MRRLLGTIYGKELGMRFTKNWEFCEKGSPGSAEATDRGQPKKEHIQYSRKSERCQGRETIAILGKEVCWTDKSGTIRSGTVRGEFCPLIELGLFFYRVQRADGETEWIPGKNLKICVR